LRRDRHNGHLFVFRGRRGGLIKVLWYDGQGMCRFAKRVERAQSPLARAADGSRGSATTGKGCVRSRSGWNGGRFLWPSPADGVVTISSAQLGYLLDGIDWRMPQHIRLPVAAGSYVALAYTR